MRLTLTFSVLACIVGCGSQAPAIVQPTSWLARAQREVARKLGVPESSVILDTVTASSYPFFSRDSTQYILYNPATEKADSLAFSALRPSEPALSVVLTYPAIERLGYFKGELRSFTPIIRAVWREVPRSVDIRLVRLAFVCGDEGCDGRDYFVPTLDHYWPRRM